MLIFCFLLILPPLLASGTTATTTTTATINTTTRALTQCEAELENTRKQYEENEKVLKGFSCCEEVIVGELGYCYFNETLTRQQADDKCATMKGHVPYKGVRTSSQRMKVVNGLEKLHVEVRAAKHWIGIKFVDGEYVWTDKEKVQKSSSWHPQYELDSNRGCVVSNDRQSVRNLLKVNKIYNKNCLEQYSVICEVNCFEL